MHAANLLKSYTKPNWVNFWQVDAPKGWFWSRYYWSDNQRQDQLNNPSSLLKLAANPYVLSVLIKVYEQQGNLPESRAILLAQLVEELLKQAQQSSKLNLVQQELFKALSQLAWQLKTSNNTKIALNSQRITADQLALAQAAQVIVLSNREVSFTHPLWLDFFTAHYFKYHDLQGLQASQLWPKASWWQVGIWDEPIKFALQLYPEPHALLAWLIPAQPVLAYELTQTLGVFKASLFLPYKVIWQQALTDIVNYPHPQERNALGLLLGHLGWDQRYGVGLDANGLPELDWVEIPAGEFIYQEHEKVALPTYQISRYLITHVQYQVFLQATDGYGNERWWQDLNKPSFAEQLVANKCNCPIPSVTWTEAVAFCRWLTSKTGLAISLPTEHQWEKAARGLDGRCYPWGNVYQQGYANCLESASVSVLSNYVLNEPSVVGIYPQGASPYGLLDMAGNVAEWCLNKEADASDIRIDDKTDSFRVYRGGAFDDEPEDVSCLRRDSDSDLYITNESLVNVGFRVCALTPTKL